MRTLLQHGGAHWVLQPGAGEPGRWRLAAEKRLASDSQPFVVIVTRSLHAHELPWLRILLWSVAAAAMVAATAAGERVVLAVRDSGPGFSPAALERGFEPFFTTREGGLGLGLSLCESLAAGMGGTLTAHNHAAGGAELRLTLPCAATPATGAT